MGAAFPVCEPGRVGPSAGLLFRKLGAARSHLPCRAEVARTGLREICRSRMPGRASASRTSRRRAGQRAAGRISHSRRGSVRRPRPTTTARSSTAQFVEHLEIAQRRCPARSPLAVLPAKNSHLVNLSGVSKLRKTQPGVLAHGARGTGSSQPADSNEVFCGHAKTLAVLQPQTQGLRTTPRTRDCNPTSGS